MRTREFTFRFLAALLLIGWSSSPAAAQKRPPNFVFILVDDLGWMDVGCYGSRFYKTPNIDKLARQGMRFTNAYAAAPVCSPTRASILTGKYPARLHLTDWLPGRPDRRDQKLARPQIVNQLPLAEVTIAEALKQAGYVSASIGKWHLGGDGFAPAQQGFDLNVAGDHTGTPASYFYPFRSQSVVMPRLEQGREGEYLTDRLTFEAEKFIEGNKDKPFFLYLPHYAVHIPLVAKRELVAKYRQETKPGQTQSNALYAAMIDSMDESVGRITGKLEELKIADNTIIVFTSDNGGLSVKEGPHTPSTSNAPLRTGKGYLYEGGIREPLIVRWPGVVKPGSVNHVPVSSVDFYPTIMEMAGVKNQQMVDGMSLTPLLKQRGGLRREEIFWHYPHYSNQGGKPGGAVRQGDFKLIEFYEDNHAELYNLKRDTGEANNLTNKMPKKTRELRQKLAAWRNSIDAQMMRLNPRYEEAGRAARSCAATTVSYHINLTTFKE
ncbi:MAG: sulfatase [Pyrinomonadaceae bacterium]|nr:sulfatase [Pyrinomonadaceae bacterium]